MARNATVSPRSHVKVSAISGDTFLVTASFVPDGRSAAKRVSTQQMDVLARQSHKNARFTGRSMKSAEFGDYGLGFLSRLYTVRKV